MSDQADLGLKISARPLRLSRDFAAVPVEKYRVLERHRLPGDDGEWNPDGKKWKVIARDRMALAQWLAVHGNPDGSRIYCSEKSMTKHFGWSRRKTFNLLRDLKRLGLLSSAGRTSEHGTRVRRLNVDVAQQWGKIAQPSAAGVQDTQAGVQDTQAGVQHRDAPNRVLPPLTEKIKTTAQNSRRDDNHPQAFPEKRKLQPQQIRYAQVGDLAEQAERLRSGGLSNIADLTFELKELAARKGIPDYGKAVARALDVVDGRDIAREISQRKAATR